MTFINGILLAGAAAFLVPLVIHLFNRSKFRVIKWGAVHLLESVVRVNRKRIQIEQIILLIVRCAIPILLAVCLARMVIQEWNQFLNWVLLPIVTLVFLICAAVFTKFRYLFGAIAFMVAAYIVSNTLGGFTLFKESINAQAPTGDVSSSTILLVDNSYSMQASGPSQTSFEQALTSIEGVLESQKRGSDVAALLMGGKPTPVFDRPTFDREGMSAQLLGQRPNFQAATPMDSLNQALDILPDMSHAKREILVVSDFQKSDWDAIPTSTLQQTAELIKKQKVPPNLTFLRVNHSENENVSIENVEYTPKTIGAGQQIRIRVNLRNHGDRAYGTGLRISLYKNNADKPDSETEVPLGPKESTQALLTCSFEEPGSHQVRIEINTPDLQFDNKYPLAFNVLSHIGVLLVDGDPSQEWLKGETDFLQIALTPFSKAKSELKDLVAPSIIPVDQLKKETLTGNKVVVLANVPKLNKDQVTLLQQFVKQGGGLLVTAGDKTDLRWYNQTLAHKTNGILPMRINDIEGDLANPDLNSRIVAQHFEHQSLQIFNDRRNGNLAEAQIQMWQKLVPSNPDMDPDSPDAPATLAILETGDPLLVERTLGDGVIHQLSIPLDTSWTNLPARPAFLPFVQQIITYLASRNSHPRNITAGQPIVAQFDPSLAGATFTLRDPEGHDIPIKAVDRGPTAVVQFNDTMKEGLYTLDNEELNSPMHFAATSPRAESKLQQLSKEELQSYAQTLGAQLIFEESTDKALKEYANLENQRKHGREMWKIMMLCVLGFMIGELCLQQYFGRAKI